MKEDKNYFYEETREVYAYSGPLNICKSIISHLIDYITFINLNIFKLFNYR